MLKPARALHWTPGTTGTRRLTTCRSTEITVQRSNTPGLKSTCRKALSWLTRPRTARSRRWRTRTRWSPPSCRLKRRRSWRAVCGPKRTYSNSRWLRMSTIRKARYCRERQSRLRILPTRLSPSTRSCSTSTEPSSSRSLKPKAISRVLPTIQSRRNSPLWLRMTELANCMLTALPTTHTLRSGIRMNPAVKSSSSRRRSWSDVTWQKACTPSRCRMKAAIRCRPHPAMLKARWHSSRSPTPKRIWWLTARSWPNGSTPTLSAKWSPKAMNLTRRSSMTALLRKSR